MCKSPIIPQVRAKVRDFICYFTYQEVFADICYKLVTKMPAGTSMHNTFRLKSKNCCVPPTLGPFSNFVDLVHVEQLSGNSKQAQFTEILPL